ncbi:MAG: DUF2283 domain-containing protein [Nanoarchaeota archaeon]
MIKENKTYDISYDENADFLEIFFDEPTKCYADEIEPGIFVRRDEETNEVKSIGILSFRKRARVLKEVLKKVNLDFPLDISLSS